MSRKEKPLVVLSWLALLLMIILTLVVGFLGEKQIVYVHKHVDSLIEFFKSEPLIAALVGLAPIVTACHSHVTKCLSMVKDRIIYGRKH